MRILVTGVAGFIGSHLADALLRRGDTVIGVDDFNDFYDPAVKRANLREAKSNSHFTLYALDVRHDASLAEAFRHARADVVVHLAARAGVRPSIQEPKLYYEVNVMGTQNVLDACRLVPPSHVVIASSSSVYGGITEVPFKETMDVSRPISPYAATKRMNELMAHVYSHLYGLNVTLLRFFTVYGPRQRPDMAVYAFTRRLFEDRPIPMFGDGTSRRDYTYIDDIIDGVLKAVDKPFRYEIFNLGESRTVELRELINALGRLAGKTPRIEPLPMQPGDVEITYADISKAREMLGYAPNVDFEEGLGRFIAWYTSNARIKTQSA